MESPLLNWINQKNLRPATLADSEAISQLVNSVYRGETSLRGWTSEASFLDGQRTDAGALREMMQKKDNVFLTQWQGPTLLASVHLEKRGEICHLGMLSVHYEAQSQGLGRKMLLASEEWARTAWQCQVMEMEVISIRKELIEFYLRRGYLKTNETAPFPYNDERFGIPRVEGLEFVILKKPLSAS